MRLTLRTLLAYLDDTLEPSEIRAIGQKVAESETAQELIARIKQVTRRRRLTTPPAGGAAGKTFDPNTIAEYLDNELDSEQVAEVEKLCLESDVHLAEIAACHQILTLVLGEPALVPPTAKERMYGLVKGREAIPFRKAPAQPSAEAAAQAVPSEDGDDALLPLGRLGVGWSLWLGALVGVCLLVVLGLALWSTLHSARQVASNEPPAAQTAEAGPPPDVPPQIPPEAPPQAPKKEKVKQEPRAAVESEKAVAKGKTTEEKETAAESKKDKPPMPGSGTAKAAERAQPPSTERRDLGSYSVDAARVPSVLLTRAADSGAWTRVEGGHRVAGTETLLSLPGCPSDLRLDSGVRLQLWGTLPEFSNTDLLLESVVTLHTPQGQDADFTLDRGRVFLTNNKDKGPAIVRIRFGKEVWDLTLLDPGAEAVLDLFKRYPSEADYRRGEGPRAELHLWVLQGKASLRTDPYQEYPNLAAPPGPAVFHWDSKSGARGPERLDTLPPFFSKELPATEQAQEMRRAVEEISKRMVGKKPDIVLHEGLQSDRPSHHALSILSLAAIDDLPALLDILADETASPGARRDRLTALHALRRWISRGGDNSRRLYDPKTGTGLLMDKKYSRGEAQTILELLHEFGPEKWRQVETFQTLVNYLTSERIAVRELAAWHLYLLAQGVKPLPAYDPAMPAEQRETVAREFQDLIKAGKLPPPAASAPAAPAGKRERTSSR